MDGPSGWGVMVVAEACEAGRAGGRERRRVGVGCMGMGGVCGEGRGGKREGGERR